jgi:hypothetical protein
MTVARSQLVDVNVRGQRSEASRAEIACLARSFACYPFTGRV